jgi:Flp pilus assembly protein TadB
VKKGRANVMSLSNGSTTFLSEERRDAINDAIDHLQAALEDARNMPSWTAALVVVTSLLCAIILLHALALMAAGPCLWVLWKRRNARVEGLLEEMDEVEMAFSPEEERCE